MLTIGSTVDDFTVVDQDGASVTWSSLRGKPVVFFFYPKANTPGCTKEACAFRDLSADFAALGVNVYGVSADTPTRQANFASKYDLKLPLLADTEHAILGPFGVWAEKTMYGKKHMGIIRSTLLFDANGVVAAAWPKVKVDGHAQEVLDAAKALVQGA